MLTKRSSLIFVVLFALLNFPAAYSQDAKPSKSKTIMLESCADTEKQNVSWLSKSIAEIDKAFEGYSSTGGQDLFDEVPKAILPVYFADPSRDGWSHEHGAFPDGMPYPGWSCWHGGIHSALYQLRWELLTDPEQKVRKLGPYQLCALESGSSLWCPSPASRRGILQYGIDGVGSCWVPGLTQHTFLSGKIRILIEVDKNRHVKTRILSTTLQPAVAQRIQQSIEALDGHPAVAFPKANAPQFDRMSIICNYSFSEPRWIGPLAK